MLLAHVGTETFADEWTRVSTVPGGRLEKPSSIERRAGFKWAYCTDPSMREQGGIEAPPPS